MGENSSVALALIAGGIGGGVLGYWRGSDDGYAKAKREDVPYIRALESENSRLRTENNQQATELLQERRSNTRLREELEKLKHEMIQPKIEKKN